ncbi:NAD(P)-dependent dehydrogenase, short-chain alcohol dehydrogenase family [Micromonospora viridifaciens]|uniref:NAD(P)-dependent dehydrogenase, short-chain alcohol dehydrogenase family n=1 Tax=Micromonospora viridifaciens TaxID=1881 RepID=A0A1C4ZZ22_MICVI|nr:SDR family NAD(P)-dependent oxidoreductase [Micromonospora viridifaciens]SCF38183.1 NAD(P)-dependent dehydrogenase, short-chain alcohol dehydrogenase family [Micromonospora viridifaciens]
MRFQDKVVFITGGASGLGAATARRFAAEGARVVIADIDAEGAERAAADLPDAYAVIVDTGDATSVERGIADAVRRYDRIDVIFNNAGIDGQQQPLHEMDVANWERVRRVNGDGMFFVLRYGIAAMLAGGGGAIVNTSSTTALAAQENISPYTFTKAGIIGLTRSAAIEYAARGIRVNAIAPTVVMTPLVEHFIDSAPDPAQMRRQMEAFNPKPGIPNPDDVAGVVLFLASDDAAWITGHTIPIDGGYVAR